MESVLAFFKSKPPFAPCPEKTVLVVGGGMAGLAAIHNLRKMDDQVKIVLINAKQYGEILWAAYRAPFEEWVAKGSLVRLQPFCDAHNVEFIQGKVTQLNKQESSASYTIMSDDTKSSAPQTIQFDVCVVATGATAHWQGMGRSIPTSLEQSTAQHRLKQLKEEGDRILAAQSVVIIGGGLIGTELAGDIAGYAQKKGQETPKVTIIQSADQLCPIMSPPAAAKVQQMLEKLGVTVYLNEKGEHTDGKVILSNSKLELDAEIVIRTTGFSAANDLMKGDYAEALDENNWIKTDEFLVVPGSKNVFAFGDCSPTLPNAGNVYMSSAATLAHNIKATLTDQLDQRKPVKVPFSMYVNTVGPDQGVVYSTAFWTQYLLPWLKNLTMFFMAPQDMIGIKKEWTLAATSPPPVVAD